VEDFTAIGTLDFKKSYHYSEPSKKYAYPLGIFPRKHPYNLNPAKYEMFPRKSSAVVTSDVTSCRD